MQVAKSKANYLIVCGFGTDSLYTVQGLNRIGALRKFAGIFMTLGPSTDEFVKSEQELSHYTISAAQWHHTQYIEDDGFFGSTTNYNTLYQQEFAGAAAHYVSAGANAVIHTLMVSLQKALKHCNIAGG